LDTQLPTRALAPASCLAIDPVWSSCAIYPEAPVTGQ
jgi:hypothetical protein